MAAGGGNGGSAGINSLSPQTRISLGLMTPRRRLCSCSSQTDADESPDLDQLNVGATAGSMRTVTLRR